MYSICLVRVDNEVCGASIKTKSGSLTGLKTHLKTYHLIDSTMNNTYFKKNQPITKYTVKKSIQTHKTLGASLARLICLDNFSLNAVANSEEIKFLIIKASIPIFHSYI